MEKAAPTKRAKQKRNRIITACFECRERKAGCDRKKPICTRCLDGRTCIYLDPPNNALINGKSQRVSSLPSEIKEKVTRLYSQCLGDTKEEEDASDYEGLEASPLVTDSASYDDDLDETEVTDLGFRIGKCHLTDRVGGQYRPGMAHELKMVLQAGSHQPEWAEEQSVWPTPPGTFDTASFSPNASFLKPSPSYLAPNLNALSIGAAQELMNYLPPSAIYSRILQFYWVSVHPVARILHRPSFERRWQTFAHDLKTNTRPAKSLLALIFAILLSGLVAMPSGILDREFGEDQKLWVQRLKAGTEIALTQAQVFQTAKVETLQAFVAYLMVLCRAEVSRVHSSLVAAAIRLAECNGLHCDGEQRGYNPIETHVRRLIWFNLCFLDIRTTEAQGPRPYIRAEDYTTKFPANINDADLTLADHRDPTEGEWAEMTLTLIRFRCNEFIRSIWVARRLVLAKEMSITPVINSIESFRLEWSLKLTPTDPNDPFQRYGLCILDLQTLRTYAMVLHPYHIHPKLQMPDRLLSILIENGIKTMDKAIEIETSEDFAPWWWYAGALHQHHYALLMALELILNPRRKESSRIWRGLDYVFEPPPLPPIARARWVVTQAWWRMEVYTGKRQLRAPIALEQNLKEALKISNIEKGRDIRPSSSSTDNTLGEEASVSSAGKKSDANSAKSLKKRATSSKSSSSRAENSPPLERLPQSRPSPGKIGISDRSTSRPSPPAVAPAKQIVDVDWGVLNNYFPPDEFSGELDVPFETWTNLLQTTPFPSNSVQGKNKLGASSQYAADYTDAISTFSVPPTEVSSEAWNSLWTQPKAQSQSNTVHPQFLSNYTPMQIQQQRLSTGWNGNQAGPQASDPASVRWAGPFGTQQQSYQRQLSTSQQQQHKQPQSSSQWQSAQMPPAEFGLPLDASAPGQGKFSPEERRRQNHDLNFNMGLFQPIDRP